MAGKAGGDLWASGLSAAEQASERRLVRLVVLAALVTGLAGAAAFAVWPDLDLSLAGSLRADGGFLLRGSALWSFLRDVNMVLYGLFYLAVLIGLLAALRHRAAFFGLEPVRWLYLLLASLAGPLLVTNIILKDHVGRPRPRDVTEFGGTLDFHQWFEWGGKCSDNCSFVSGEVSSMVMMVTSLAFAAPRWRRPLALALPPAWFYAAYMRAGQGAHFPSDTFLAGIFMILIAALCYRWTVLAR